MQEVNVKVAVRVRPLLPKEKLGGEQLCVKVVPGSNQLVVGKDRAFTFDHVFTSKSKQEDVYNTCVRPLVTNIFEGYNATVFAYGQTGSGKTYTIGGGNTGSLTEEEYGVIPRAVQEMFEVIQSKTNVQYSIKVSYIEIYKEELRDLLDLETSSKDLHIREDENGNTIISGHREIECSALDEVMYCLQHGSSARHTGSTQMNEQSSRSHSIFTVTIEQSWCDQISSARGDRDDGEDESGPEEIQTFINGKFHFVDLAGSERAHRTGNVGDRFKESVHINSGLLALGNVISALGDPRKKAHHIPYRDSKITRLLKDSLGGNANTLMICCASPAGSSFDETLNSLKYANRAKNIKNKPVVNRDSHSMKFAEMQDEIMALREELHRQRTSILTANTMTADYDLQKAIQDAGQVKDLEDRLVKLQTECSHYRMVAEEAYKQFTDIQDRDILSKSQNFRLKDWLDLMDELESKVPSTLDKDQWNNQTIMKLQKQLQQCQSDLKSDEEIFAEKNKEVSQLHEKLEELVNDKSEKEQMLEEMLEKQRQQEEQLVQQQLEIDQLQEKLVAKKRLLSLDSCDDPEETESLPPTTSRRAKSVPAHLMKRRRSSNTNADLRPPSRNIHTSPALFSMDRVMQGFRARSQLLVARLEDNDEVLHHGFSDTESSSSGDDDKKENRALGKTFKAGTVGTFKVPRITLPNGDKSQVSDIKKKANNKKSNLANMGGTMSLDKLKGKKPAVNFENDDILKSGDLDVKKVKSSTEIHKKKIKESQLNMQESNQKMRDLAMNIRLKEQLIRELVKTGKDAEQMSKQYGDKIALLEKEKEQLQTDLKETQKACQGLELKEHKETIEKQKLQSEYQKKIDTTKAKLTAVQKKLKENEKFLNMTNQNDKRIQELELNVDRMKQQHDLLQKRLKEESERKTKLEREMQKEQQKIKELEIRNEQQQKILKRKNEEIAAAQRKLRSTSSGKGLSFSGRLSGKYSEEVDKVEEQKKWLDGEIEKVVEQKRQMQQLQEELKKREDIVAKKESILKEKSELEMKKLRSSQVLNKDMLTIDRNLEAVEMKLLAKSRDFSSASSEDKQKFKDELQNLNRAQEKLRRQRAILDEKLYEGALISPQEERRLIELDEAVEALDAAIVFKSEMIENQQQEIRRSQMLTQSEDNLMNKLNSLSGTESRNLLFKYFEKVVNLRESEKNTELQLRELEVKADEQERLIREMQYSLKHATMETDIKLTQQQKEYEGKIQMLVRQLTDLSQEGSSAAKITQLEKDLYYYKKTSRDLKKKLREVLADRLDHDGGGDVSDSVGSAITTARENGDTTHRSSRMTATPRTARDQYTARDGSPLTSRPLSSRQTPMSSRSEIPSQMKNKDGSRQVTPVKISRKDLRPMTAEEVQMRRSNVSQASVQDSLDAGNNPWS